MSLEIEIQFATDVEELPTKDQLTRWGSVALQGRCSDAQFSIRVVDEEESARLNSAYRRKEGSTNVLSFPVDLPDHVETPLLGDVVICAPVVLREADEQGKTAEAHWAHMVIHGVLHLLGFDHDKEPAARYMEKLETELLDAMGYPDPYQLQGSA